MTNEFVLSFGGFQIFHLFIIPISILMRLAAVCWRLVTDSAAARTRQMWKTGQSSAHGDDIAHLQRGQSCYANHKSFLRHKCWSLCFAEEQEVAVASENALQHFPGMFHMRMRCLFDSPLGLLGEAIILKTTSKAILPHKILILYKLKCWCLASHFFFPQGFLEECLKDNVVFGKNHSVLWCWTLVVF